MSPHHTTPWYRVRRAGFLEALQGTPTGVEGVRMSRCHHFNGYGRHSRQPTVPWTTQLPPVSTQKLMCAKCGDPLDGHEMFGKCFPQEYLGESPPLVVRNGRLAAL